MLKIVFTCNWEIRYTGKRAQKPILLYKKIEGIGIREASQRCDRREGKWEEGVIRSKHFRGGTKLKERIE